MLLFRMNSVMASGGETEAARRGVRRCHRGAIHKGRFSCLSKLVDARTGRFWKNNAQNKRSKEDRRKLLHKQQRLQRRQCRQTPRAPLLDAP